MSFGSFYDEEVQCPFCGHYQDSYYIPYDELENSGMITLVECDDCCAEFEIQLHYVYSTFKPDKPKAALDPVLNPMLNRK